MDGQNLETAVAVGEAALGALVGSNNRTISSGVDRLQTAASGAGAILAEFGALVGSMTGKTPSVGLNGEGSTEPTGTAGAIHDAASLFESFVSQVAMMVKSARAAHG